MVNSKNVPYTGLNKYQNNTYIQNQQPQIHYLPGHPYSQIPQTNQSYNPNQLPYPYISNTNQHYIN